MALGYSDLEVNHDRDETAPEVVRVHGAPNSIPVESKPQYDPRPVTQKRRVCGLSRKKFWIVFGITALAILIAAAVAGGLAATQAAKPENDRKNEGPESDSRVSTSPPLASASSSSTLVVTPTTSTIIGPQQTLYRDCPSSNNTIYNAIGSVDFQFRKICGRSYKQPFANVINEKAASLDECINLCAVFNLNNKSDIADGKSTPCTSVCWRHKIDEGWPGQCFGSVTYNSTSGFEYRDEDYCDSGAWINQDVQ
jgi:hypothetical protein